MPRLYGRHQDPHELRRRAGDLSQFGGVTALELTDGRARGVRGLLFRTGRLTFLVLADRGLDIAWAELDGRPLGWMSGTGIVAPAYYEPEGVSWLRSFYGGLLATCGLSNVGLPSDDGAMHYGLHGRVGHAAAERLAHGAGWDGDDYVLWAEGTLREAIVFGEHLVLNRRIEARLGEATIRIVDTVENHGWQPSPLMLLYHVNTGYPLLDEGSRVHLRATATHPRNPQAEAGLAEWRNGSAPRPGFLEQVFHHEVEPDAEGWARAVLENPHLDQGQGLALAVRYHSGELPYFWQWRMVGEGTYVMGLEPSNCGLRGRVTELAADAVRTIGPGERVTFRLELEAARGYEEVQSLVQSAGGAPS